MLETKQEISGFLIPYFQVGTDRVLWSISDLENVDTLQVHSLQENDYLIVYHHSGLVRWEGQIHFEYVRNNSPRTEFWTRQIAFGYVVHGFQSNCVPEDWATMFFAELPATLRRK